MLLLLSSIVSSKLWLLPHVFTLPLGSSSGVARQPPSPPRLSALHANPPLHVTPPLPATLLPPAIPPSVFRQPLHSPLNSKDLVVLVMVAKRSMSPLPPWLNLGPMVSAMEVASLVSTMDVG